MTEIPKYVIYHQKPISGSFLSKITSRLSTDYPSPKTTNLQLVENGLNIKHPTTQIQEVWYQKNLIDTSIPAIVKVGEFDRISCEIKNLSYMHYFWETFIRSQLRKQQAVANIPTFYYPQILLANGTIDQKSALVMTKLEGTKLDSLSNQLKFQALHWIAWWSSIHNKSGVVYSDLEWDHFLFELDQQESNITAIGVVDHEAVVILDPYDQIYSGTPLIATNKKTTPPEFIANPPIVNMYSTNYSLAVMAEQILEIHQSASSQNLLEIIDQLKNYNLRSSPETAIHTLQTFISFLKSP